MLRYTTDIARPGLVALYDIRPGNGAGQFLQPRSPHRTGHYGALNVLRFYICFGYRLVLQESAQRCEFYTMLLVQITSRKINVSARSTRFRTTKTVNRRLVVQS